MHPSSNREGVCTRPSAWGEKKRPKTGNILSMQNTYAPRPRNRERYAPESIRFFNYVTKNGEIKDRKKEGQASKGL